MLDNASLDPCQPLLIGPSDYNFGVADTVVELPKVMCFDFGHMTIGNEDSYDIKIKGNSTENQDAVLLNVYSTPVGSYRYWYFNTFNSSSRYTKYNAKSFDHDVKVYVKSKSGYNYDIYLYIDGSQKVNGGMTDGFIRYFPYIMSPFNRMYITGTVSVIPELSVYMVDNVGD